MSICEAFICSCFHASRVNVNMFTFSIQHSGEFNVVILVLCWLKSDILSLLSLSICDCFVFIFYNGICSSWGMFCCNLSLNFSSAFNVSFIGSSLSSTQMAKLLISFSRFLQDSQDIFGKIYYLGWCFWQTFVRKVFCLNNLAIIIILSLIFTVNDSTINV